MCDSCEKTEFGCCVDLENAALGPNFDGCPAKNGTGGGYKDCTLTVSVSIAAMNYSAMNIFDFCDTIKFELALTGARLLSGWGDKGERRQLQGLQERDAVQGCQVGML